MRLPSTFPVLQQCQLFCCKKTEATKDESKYISPVLTSAQNMRLLEKKKEEDMNAKEKWKLEREEKKIKKLYLENAKINLCKYSRYM